MKQEVVYSKVEKHNCYFLFSALKSMTYNCLLESKYRRQQKLSCYSRYFPTKKIYQKNL